MNVKRFIAENMQDAMNRIKNEYGPDAVILNSRNIRKKGIKGLFSKPMVEVMIGYEPRESRINRYGSGRVYENKSVHNEDKLEKLEEKISNMNRMMETLVNRIKSNPGIPYDRYSEEVALLLDRLLDNDVNETLALEIADEVQDIVNRQAANPQEVMAHIIAERLGSGRPVSIKKYKRQVVLLVGPTGIGKTTTLAKLAADFSLNRNAKVGLLTTDTYRIAAVEQLKTYAEILNIPLDVVYDVDNIDEVLKNHEDKDIVFIDTAGRSPGDAVQEMEISALIEKTKASEVYLVLSATTSFKGCMHIIDNYSFLKDYNLIITKVDETPARGSILNIINYAGKPVGYLGTGQNVPDDIEEFNPEKVVNLLLGKEN